MIRPTSRTALKQQCLVLSHLDVDKAEKMYDFLVKDIEGLPDTDPEGRSFLDNFKDQAGGILSWLRDNQDMISQGVDFVRGVIASRKGTPTAPLPPIE